MPLPSTTVVLLELKKVAHTHNSCTIYRYFLQNLQNIILDTILIFMKGMCHKGGINFSPDTQMSYHLGLLFNALDESASTWVTEQRVAVCPLSKAHFYLSTSLISHCTVYGTSTVFTYHFFSLPRSSGNPLEQPNHCCKQ